MRGSLVYMHDLLKCNPGGARVWYIGISSQHLTLMIIGSDLYLEEKIQGIAHHDFQDYFDEHPEAVEEFVALLKERFPGNLVPELPSLFHSWATDMGIDDHALLRELAPSATATSEGKQLFAQAEREWMEIGPRAPVAIATMVFQKHDDLGDDIVPITNDPTTNRIEWDVSFSIMDVSPDQRNLSCERDTYESDVHREADGAPREARDWEGPFQVEVGLFKPSEHLKSLRLEAWLYRALPEKVGTLGRAPSKIRV